MALKLGNNYIIFVATIAAPTVFAMIGGQQSGSFGDNRSKIDASHKTSGGINLTVAGNRDVSFDMGFVADLPDAGYTMVESSYKANLDLIVQLRDAGAASVADDAVFECRMINLQRPIDMPLNGTVTGSFRWEPTAVPTLDLTLA